MSKSIPKKDKELYQLMGYALSRWQLVELALFFNFWRFMQLADYKVPSAAFHGIQAFSGKLSMTELAGKEALRELPEYLSKWEKLTDRCRKKNEKRNHLVHFTIRNDKSLAPSRINIAAFHRWGNKMPGYKKEQLIDMADSFSSLANELFQFAKDVPLPYLKRPAPDEQ